MQVPARVSFEGRLPGNINANSSAIPYFGDGRQPHIDMNVTAIVPCLKRNRFLPLHHSAAVAPAGKGGENSSPTPGCRWY